MIHARCNVDRIGSADSSGARARVRPSTPPSSGRRPARNSSGVQELGDDAVNIRVIVWVEAGERRRLERVLRRCLEVALDAAGVEMPNRRVDVWMRHQNVAA